jgi:hypothetical protein
MRQKVIRPNYIEDLKQMRSQSAATKNPVLSICNLVSKLVVGTEQSPHRRRIEKTSDVHKVPAHCRTCPA